MRFLLLALVLPLGSMTPLLPQDRVGDPKQKLQGTKVVLADGRELETGLNEATIQARLARATGSDLLVVSGRTCSNCQAPVDLFVIDPDVPMPSFQDGKHAWHNAGTLVDLRTNETYYEAQVFAGNVLPDTDGVIWYERSLMPNGEWKTNTTLLRVRPEGLDTVAYFGHDRLSTTQGLAFKGQCKVITGAAQQVMP